MTLFKEWNNLIGNQTKSTIDSFWEEYAGGEKKIYQDILANYPAKPAGKIGELAAKYEVRPVIFMGFLDGIQTSLANPADLNALDEESEIELDIQWETLLFNMFKADADYLYGLEEWLNIVSEERYKEIYDEFRRSRTVRVEKKPGRNDPCPCGSGKKYKNCCGKNA